jgi:catechol 2,3-dioxygenase-like lactoylglutathione lyase family enzyme
MSASGFLGFDHVDVRVRSLAAVEPFYDALLPELGLTVKTYSFVGAAGDWHDAKLGGAYNAVEYWEPAKPRDQGRFIGFIDDPDMLPVRTRIAFLVESELDVRSFGARLREIGARNVEFEYPPGDERPAVFFSDPAGTLLEICARGPVREGSREP